METQGEHSTSRRTLGPIELEVIHGTIRAAELEIEAAVERTARSPMIRDQHDYRVALFDAKGRKLTGRSYSAIVEPVFEYFGADDIHPGDVFLWNDPIIPAAASVTCPTSAPPCPIFEGERLIGFSQVSATMTMSAARCPEASGHATDRWMEGLLVPAHQALDKRQADGGRLPHHRPDSRLSEHLTGDLDAEQGAARSAPAAITALADRYGVDALEPVFDQILHNTAATFRREPC